ncbi:MAG: RNA polymerase sigma factor [Ginsengibacter sp.]
MQPVNIKPKLEEHHKEYYGWALHCCSRDAEMARDVLQSSYLKMLVKQTTFRGEAALKTWAFVIIKNTAIDALRKKQREVKRIQSENHIVDTGYETGAEDIHDKKLRKLFFTEALNQLSERQREILQLVFYHDLSLNQSAEILSISQGAIRKHYDRAKKALADWFEKKGIAAFK